jgi:hypothetical protein
LNFHATADGQSLTVSRRLRPNCSAWPYMRFILNDKDVPSIAQMILLSQ